MMEPLPYSFSMLATASSIAFRFLAVLDVFHGGEAPSGLFGWLQAMRLVSRKKTLYWVNVQCQEFALFSIFFELIQMDLG